MVFAAGKSNNENYTFCEMPKQDDASDFIKAMEKESNDPSSHGHWEIVKRFEIPPGVKNIQEIWYFNRNRFTDGTLNKHKACICDHGGMQQLGVHYRGRYSPVLNWISVQFLLILSELAGLESRTIDFFWHSHK